MNYNKLLDKNQFSLLSYYGTILFMNKHCKGLYPEAYVNAIESACVHANISDEIIINVQQGNVKGLQNKNRISLIEFFE